MVNGSVSRSDDPSRAARQAGLRYVSDAQPGIQRRRAGRGFRYLDADGQPVRDPATLARIRALAIPPAYASVWICADADGHLQATGRDARGRKQYRYHAHWSQLRNTGKFDRIIAFGAALPQLRRKVRADLALSGLPRDKVLAMVVALLGNTLLRVGNDAYVRSNRSYGLTTLRARHLEWLKDGRAQVKFRGKSGKEQSAVIDDRRLVKLVRRCQQLPGQLLFQYRDAADAVQPVDSGAVNDYLRQAMGNTFSAKDFRTWGATLVALREMAQLPLPPGGSEYEMASLQNQVIAAVAAMLGNTPAVCRKSYIDPCAFSAWREGRLTAFEQPRGPRQWERATLQLLRACHRRGAQAQPQ
ncbi:DNA topoisomerase IB [Stenotrophomonas sp. YIM B06876]|uniref:DNA topoisomerase IB n=1 Tax=Stenotrophomonas sp. YIM B06876 TaxID=3060211 RepID=UPI00273957CF|nr:DNA topoisomerase IB [Stenotrophomonas sp. YIM B06876]